MVPLPSTHHSARFNPLNAELNTICHLLELLGAHHILHVSKVGVKGHFNPLNGVLNTICHLLALLGAHHILHFSKVEVKGHFNPLNAKLNPISHFLALLGAHHILHVSRIRVNIRMIAKESVLMSTSVGIMTTYQFHVSVYCLAVLTFLF